MKNAKIIICLIALFALGAASGIGITRAVQPSAAPQHAWAEQPWIERRYAEEVQRLNLTPTQQESLRSHYDGIASGMREIRDDTARQVRDLFTKKSAEVWKMLTPAQREDYRKLNEERRARNKKPTS
jgi:hypothetical protein